jgi:organic hydroperoxide reductase OsmC/OhrA
MTDEHGIRVDLTLREGFAFDAEVHQDEVPALRVDEPPPLGESQGPNAARLLATAVGHCLSSSLLFCARRARIEIPELRTVVEASLVRNERGRLRIGELRVRLHPGLEPAARERLGRCLEIFEDFCIVGQSVKQGIPLQIEVESVAREAANAA